MGRWDQCEKSASVLWPGKGLLPLSLLNLVVGGGGDSKFTYTVDSRRKKKKERSGQLWGLAFLSSLQLGGYTRDGGLPGLGVSGALARESSRRLGSVQGKVRANGEAGQKLEAKLSRGSLQSAGCPCGPSRPWPAPMPFAQWGWPHGG